MNPYKLVAVQVARKAGAVLKKKMGTKRTIGYKGAINLVTEMDLLSEKIIGCMVEHHRIVHDLNRQGRQGRQEKDSVQI